MGGEIAQNFNMPLVHFAHSCKALRQALCVKFAARGAMEGGRDDTPPQPCLLDGNNLPQGQNTACSIARAFVILAACVGYSAHLPGTGTSSGLLH